MNELEKQKLKAEIKQEKKTKRLLKKSAWAIGGGIGLIVIKLLITPFIGDSPEIEANMVKAGLCLAGYGLAVILSFVFLRKFLFKIDLLLTWIILPLIALKLLMNVM